MSRQACLCFQPPSLTKHEILLIPVAKGHVAVPAFGPAVFHYRSELHISSIIYIVLYIHKNKTTKEAEVLCKILKNQHTVKAIVIRLVPVYCGLYTGLILTQFE